MNPEENKPKNSEEQLPAEQPQQESSQESPADLPPEQSTAPKGKKKTAGKGDQPAEEKENSLRALGLAALAEHGMPAAYVTSDGQVFALYCDAAAHASTLSEKTIEKVEQ